MNKLITQVPENYSGGLTSPDLRFRDSVMLWGPLRVSILSHREGTELGFRAGEEAYHQVNQQVPPANTVHPRALRTMMRAYLAHPRHRPRTLTATILAEWKAMFLLAWMGQMLETTSLLQETEEPQSTVETPQPALSRRRDQ